MNSSKLDLLVRQNKARTEHTYYAVELSHLLKNEIQPKDILSLEETDRWFSTHRSQSVRSNQEAGVAWKKSWKYKPGNDWLDTCKCLAERLQNEAAVLFAGPYEFCGGVKVEPSRALGAAIQLIEFDQNTLRLQSVSSESGLYLDLFEENSEWLVELVIWGQWKLLADECLE